jgi:hypothetical protein
VIVQEKKSMPVEEAMVPKFELWQVPACPYCSALFVLDHGQGESYETWRQSCQCQPQDNCGFMTMYEPKDGRSWMQEHFQGERIGKSIVIHCLFCSKPMVEGQPAMRGQMGRFNYGGYAHISCFEEEQAQEKQAQEEAARAEKGVSIAFWYSWSDPLVPAPQTGHYDAAVRMVPQDLPAFPLGAVIYEQYRRPFAMSYVDIPLRADAEEWWKQASANEAAAYELHWYEPGKKDEQATRSWKGKGFSRVESEARMAEWDAMRDQGV